HLVPARQSGPAGAGDADVLSGLSERAAQPRRRLSGDGRCAWARGGTPRLSHLGRSANRRLAGVRLGRPATTRASWRTAADPGPPRGGAGGGLWIAGGGLVASGWGLSCLSSLYPVAQGPQPFAYVYPDTEQRTESPVLPRFTEGSARDVGAYFTDPPFVPPPAE